jgi:hypothetical protein
VKDPFCVCDGGCASWGGVQAGFASWGGQVRVVNLVYSSWGVQVCVCRSGVVNSWFQSFDGEASPPRRGESTRGSNHSLYNGDGIRRSDRWTQRQSIAKTIPQAVFFKALTITSP